MHDYLTPLGSIPSPAIYSLTPQKKADAKHQPSGHCRGLPLCEWVSPFTNRPVGAE